MVIFIKLRYSEKIITNKMIHALHGNLSAWSSDDEDENNDYENGEEGHMNMKKRMKKNLTLFQDVTSEQIVS
jgi:hypothetical protein